MPLSLNTHTPHERPHSLHLYLSADFHIRPFVLPFLSTFTSIGVGVLRTPIDILPAPSFVLPIYAFSIDIFM